MENTTLWALTNQGAIDFLTMQRVFPAVVKRLIELETKVITLENKQLQLEVRNPLFMKRTIPVQR